MHTVLRTNAGRVSLAMTLAVAAAGALSAPAWASFAAPRHSAPAQHTTVHSGSAVDIGTAVAYVRLPDGTIRQLS